MVLDIENVALQWFEADNVSAILVSADTRTLECVAEFGNPRDMHVEVRETAIGAIAGQVAAGRVALPVEFDTDLLVPLPIAHMLIQIYNVTWMCSRCNTIPAGAGSNRACQ